MTTVAYDGETLAADTKMESAEGKTYYSSKLWALPGWRFAGSGDQGVLKHLREQITGADDVGQAVLSLTLPAADANKALVLCITPKQAFLFDGRKTVAVSGPTAVGTGAAYALPVVRTGHSAKVAVAVAALLDPHTGGRAQESEPFTDSEKLRCVLVTLTRP